MALIILCRNINSIQLWNVLRIHDLPNLRPPTYHRLPQPYRERLVVSLFLKHTSIMMAVSYRLRFVNGFPDMDLLVQRWIKSCPGCQLSRAQQSKDYHTRITTGPNQLLVVEHVRERYIWESTSVSEKYTRLNKETRGFLITSFSKYMGFPSIVNFLHVLICSKLVITFKFYEWRWILSIAGTREESLKSDGRGGNWTFHRCFGWHFRSTETKTSGKILGRKTPRSGVRNLPGAPPLPSWGFFCGATVYALPKSASQRSVGGLGYQQELAFWFRNDAMVRNPSSFPGISTCWLHFQDVQTT